MLDVYFMLPPLLSLQLDCAKKSVQSIVLMSLGALVHLIEVGGYQFSDHDGDTLLKSIRDASYTTQPIELLNNFGFENTKHHNVFIRDLDSPSRVPADNYLSIWYCFILLQLVSFTEIQDPPLFVPLHPYQGIKEKEVKCVEPDMYPPEKVQHAVDYLQSSPQDQDALINSPQLLGFQRRIIVDYAKAYTSGKQLL